MAPLDQLRLLLKTTFGFIGLNDAHFINVYPVKFSLQELLSKAILKAPTGIVAMVKASENLLDEKHSKLL